MYNNLNGDFKSRLASERKIPTENIDMLEKKGLLLFQNDYALFSMKDLDGNIIGHQKRFAIPKKLGDKELKSQTCQGEHVGYYYLDLDFSKPVIICEGEIDFLSICNIDNVIGLQGVHNLKKLVDELLTKNVPEFFLLVDHDNAGDTAIGKLLGLGDENLSKIYDSRLVLLDNNDVNDLLRSGGTINKDDIIGFGKGLLEFKKVIESFYTRTENGTVKVNYPKFAKYLVNEKDIISSIGNIFMYNRYGERKGIRSEVNKYTFESYIRKWMDDYLGHIIKCFTKQNKLELIDAIYDYSNSEEFAEHLLQTNSTDLCLSDGILDINTGKIHEYTKEEYKFNKFYYSSSDLLNKKQPEKLLKFLDEVFDGYEDKLEIINLVQEYMGLLLIPYTKYEKALLIYGSGCNGKGVLLNIIQQILGENNCSAVSLHELKEQQYLYSMINTLANIDSDIKEKSRLDDGIIKKIISGEMISAKKLYKNPISFKPVCRLIIATNILPYIKSIDNSITRRFIFIHFKNNFEKRKNLNLINEILEEENEIFTWMVEGLKRLHKRGAFNIPHSLENELTQFIEKNDIVLQFIKDPDWINCDKDEYIEISFLYDTYKSYCIDYGYKPLGKHNFDERLVDKGFKKEKKGGSRCFIGLGKTKNNSGHLDISNE